MKRRRKITKGYIYHRLLRLESEIILTEAALRKWRGGYPTSLSDILDSIQWARRMMKSLMLRYWLHDVDDIMEEYNASDIPFKNYDLDREMMEQESERIKDNPHLQQTLENLSKQDIENGIIPRPF